LLTAIIIALFLWFSRTPNISAPGTSAQSQAAPSGQKPPQQQAPSPAAQILDAENTAPEPQTAAADTQEKPPAEIKEIVPVQSLPDETANARQVFASGKFSAAGDLWGREMVAEKIAFSILLEMDCLEESVNNAYQQITDKENFFILNRVKDGRSCWLVFWGKFRTQNEAQQNLELIPEYFFKQSDPPRIIDLAQYL
jgi:hypothetical protein